MSSKGQVAGPEVWESIAWEVYDHLEAARRRQGKQRAAALASKALEAIDEPAQPALKEATDART